MKKTSIKVAYFSKPYHHTKLHTLWSLEFLLLPPYKYTWQSHDTADHRKLKELICIKTGQLVPLVFMSVVELGDIWMDSLTNTVPLETYRHSSRNWL
jgi:hypothetical protein